MKLLKNMRIAFILVALASAAHASTPYPALENFRSDMVKLVKDVWPGVVFISTRTEVSIDQGITSLEPLLREFFGGPGMEPHNKRSPYKKMPKEKYQQEGAGSGFVIDQKNGYIFTNNHVVGDASEINVKTIDGKTYKAKVVGKDKDTDTAIIQVKDLPSNIKELPFAESESIEIGEPVIAIGAPLGVGQSVSWGLVSAKNRGSFNITNFGDFIQTDAAINPGNSGGPLLNTRGEVVGMNTVIFSRSGGSQGVGFAIPSKILVRNKDSLIKHGKVYHARLGIQLQELNESLNKSLKLDKDQQGALVASVVPDSPAEKSGIKKKDVIYQVDEKKIESVTELRNFIGGLLTPGSKVKIHLFRKGSKKIVDVVLGSMEEDSNIESTKANNTHLGLDVEEVPANELPDKISGVKIVHVDKEHQNWKNGLRPGMIIHEIDEHSIKNMSDFKKYTRNYAKGKKGFEVQVYNPWGKYYSYHIMVKENN